jgi:septum formation topological specificity factor MinE
LNQQLDLYKQELSFVVQRIECIEQNNIENLNRVIKKERALGEEIKALEDLRIELFQKTEYEKLSDLINDLNDENQKEKLSSLKEELLSVINEIKDKNELCSKLINISSEMIEKLMSGLAGKKEVGYNKFRKKENISSNNLLNTKG